MILPITQVVHIWGIWCTPKKEEGDGCKANPKNLYRETFLAYFDLCLKKYQAIFISPC